MLLRSVRSRASGFIEPCLPSLAPNPPDGVGWIHEIKLDGLEFRTADGEALVISIPASETRVTGTFRSECPMGYSCRTFREEPLPRPCIAQAEPSYTSPKAVGVPETPP
jgi:hypothetical protein